MDKKTGIIIGVGILLVVVGVYVFGRSSNSADSVEEDVSSLTGSESFSGTMADLLALGQDYQCTFNMSDEEGNETGGTVYMADGGDKMYGEFALSMGDGESYTSFVIRDGTYNYVWSSAQLQGMKMLVEEGDDDFIASDGEADVDYGVDYDQNYSYDCNAWSVDESMFVPPADVEFMDFSSMIEEVTATFEQSGVDCSVCDQIPEGDAKTQCLSALGC